MAVGTTLSRLTGVLRIFALAYALGSGVLADSYNLANTMPNIIHDIVLGGILSATFMPVFVQWLTTRPEDEAWEAISAVTSVTMIVIGAASVLFLAADPLVIDATTSLNHGSQAAATRHVATELLLLIRPPAGLLRLHLSGHRVAQRQAAFRRAHVHPDRQQPRARRPRCSCSAPRCATPRCPALAQHRNQLLLLGLGTTAGVVLQAGLMVPSLRRAGLRLTWRPDLHHPAVRTILRLSGWTFGLVVANQVALLVILALAGQGGPGRSVGVHVRLDVLPAPVRRGGRVGHDGHGTRAHRTLWSRGRSRRLPTTHGHGLRHHHGHRHTRRPPAC